MPALASFWFDFRELPKHFGVDFEKRMEALVDWREHIWVDAERMHGTPCLRRTRIPVYVILDNLAAGETVETILDQYPALRPEHIPAALAFAAELAHERIVPIPA